MTRDVDNSSSRKSLLNWAGATPSSSVTEIIAKFRTQGENLQSSAELTRKLSNWQTYMYDELQRTIFLMTRLPEGHDFFLDPVVGWRASEILGWLRSNTDAEPPKVVNEEGDTIMFTWNDGDLKKYLCVDESKEVVEARKKGTPYVASEVVGDSQFVDGARLAELLGIGIKSNSVS